MAESQGIPTAGEVPVATADAQPGVDEGALWKAKFYQQQENDKIKEKQDQEKIEQFKAEQLKKSKEDHE